MCANTSSSSESCPRTRPPRPSPPLTVPSSCLEHPIRTLFPRETVDTRTKTSRTNKSKIACQSKPASLSCWLLEVDMFQ